MGLSVHSWNGSDVSAALGVLTLLVIPAGILLHRKVIRPLQRMTYDWHGEPERRGAAGQLIAEARPGVMEQLKTLDTRQQSMDDRQDSIETQISVVRGDMAAVRAQLRPNGGESVYDKVTGTAEKVAQIIEGKTG